MQEWNYQNPKILEMRYEEIVGNELMAFQTLFTHYGLHDKVAARGLELANRFSIAEMKKKNRTTGHVRDGSIEQWRKVFIPEHVSIFNQLFPDMMLKLGYSE